MGKNTTEAARLEEVRKKARIIGIVSITLIVVFFILLFVGIISFIEWLILVIATWLAANFGLRRVKRPMRL